MEHIQTVGFACYSILGLSSIWRLTRGWSANRLTNPRLTNGTVRGSRARDTLLTSFSGGLSNSTFSNNQIVKIVMSGTICPHPIGRFGQEVNESVESFPRDNAVDRAL